MENRGKAAPAPAPAPTKATSYTAFAEKQNAVTLPKPEIVAKIDTAVSKTLDTVKDPQGPIAFNLSKPKIADLLKQQAELRRPTEAETAQMGATSAAGFGDKIKDIARKVLPAKIEDIFGLTPKSNAYKRVEAWGDLSLNYDRMKELDDVVQETAKEKFPDGNVRLPADYKESTGFWGQAKEGFIQAYIGTVKPVIGSMLEQAAISPESVAWGKKQADKAVAELILRPELDKPADLPDFFAGGASDKRWWGRAIGGSIPSIASALAASVATAVVTRNPAAATSAAWATTFSMEKANAYRDMLDKGVAPDKANTAATIYGTIAAQLEIGMGVNPGKLASNFVLGTGKETGGLISKGLADSFLKYTNSTLIKAPTKTLVNAIQEGNEEAAQQFTQNLVTGFLYSGQGLTEGVAESWAQGFAGGLPLGAADTVVTDFRGSGSEEPPEKKSAPEIEAAIKEDVVSALKDNHSPQAVEDEIRKEFGIPASTAERMVQEAATEAGINIPGIFETGGEEDVLGAIDQAAKEVRGDVQKVDEKVPDNVAEILGELSDSAEAQQDWQDNHADDFLKLSDQLTKLEQEHKDAKKSERADLERQMEKLSAKMGKMENDFIAKYEEKAKEIAQERATQKKTESAIADVEAQVSKSRRMESPEAQSALTELEGKKPSEVLSYLEQQDNLLDQTDGEERQLAITRGNVAGDIMNEYWGKNAQTVVEVKGKNDLPVLQVQVVEYDNGTWGARSEYNVGNSGGTGPFGTDTFASKEEAIASEVPNLRKQIERAGKEKIGAAAAKRALEALDKIAAPTDNTGNEKDTDTRGGIRRGKDTKRGANDRNEPQQRGGSDRQPGDLNARGERSERGTGNGERSFDAITVRQRSSIGKVILDLMKVGGAELDTEFSVTRKVEGFEDLTVERIGNVVYLRHTYLQNGDVMFDPEVSFDIIDGQLVAKTIEQSPFPPRGIKPRDSFLKMWAENIRAQGFLNTEEARPEDVVSTEDMMQAAEDAPLREDVLEDAQERQDAIETTDEEIESIARRYTRVDGAPGAEYVTIADYEGTPTAEEIAKINTYTGAGGREKEGAEGRGLLDEYYTPQEVTTMTGAILSRIGAFKSGMRVLEPSAGTGAFLMDIPSDSVVDAHEINEIAARILKLNHKDANVSVEPFESLFMGERGEVRTPAAQYDLVIGNPPYGGHRGKYKGMGEEPKITRYEEYFLKRALDVTKEGGYVAMVVPSGFLRTGPSKAKEEITRTGELVAAYRLPNGAFPTTDIGTDILVFKRITGGWVMSPLIGDNYFTEHPDHILGTVVERKGRFGMAEGVEGTIDDAADRFYRVVNDESAAEITTDPEEQEGIVSDIEDAYKPEALKEARNKAQPQKKLTAKEIAKNEKVSVKTTKTKQQLKLAQYSTATGPEAALWKYVQPTGELKGDFDKAAAMYYKGEYFNKFNYLQGDIYEKLDQLEQDKKTIGDAKYAEQKKALESVLPPRVSVDRINVPPNSRMAQDLMITIDGKEDSLAAHFLTWINKLPMAALGQSSTYAIRGYVYGNPVRGGDKLQNEAERRTRRVEGDRLFKLFLRENLPAEAKDIVELAYNRQFNAYARPDYRNVPLVGTLNNEFHGKPLEIRDVQLQGVGFLVNRGVGLLAHDVGVGKTMQLIVATNEVLKRGWAKRPLIVTPNPNVNAQWIKEMSQLLPDVRINLLANLGGDFKGDLATLEIPEGSISIITEEGFKRLGFKDETYTELTKDFLDAIEDPSEGSTKRNKELRNAQAEEQVAKGIKGTRTERFFEDLGFDHLTVDEVHNANHIISSAKVSKNDKKQATEFRGFNVKPSQFGIKTWLAAQYVQKMNNGRNVQLASATPFTNNPLEYYSILSLMARERMQRMGILNVNDFMTMFMDIRVALESKADGSVQEKAEVRGIKNYQQFQKLLTEFIDFRDGEEAGVVRPERASREYVVGQTPDQVQYAAAAQALFADKENAGALKAIGELRAAAFSPFLSRYYSGPMPSPSELVKQSPKLRLMADLIKQSLKDNPEGGHLIYSPVGVELFPIIKDALVKITGLDESAVQIISGATPKPKRMTIQENFNAGTVKIVLGSDAIQEGVNLQANTTDLHILSMPWNFTALRQVTGRAWRQGNRWPRVRVNTYFTENSVDVFLSQKLSNKEARYSATLQFKGDYLDVGDIDFEEMKVDLITDPVRRTEMEYQIREQELNREIQRMLSDQGYKNRRASELIDAQRRLRDARETAKLYSAEWAQSGLKNAEKNLAEVSAKLADRGIDISDIEKELADAEAEVAKVRTQIEKLQEEKTVALEAAAKSKNDLVLEAHETDYGKYVAERKEDNSTFYEKASRRSLTTNILRKLAGRTTVSKQFIEDLTNSPELKQVERDITRLALRDEGPIVDVQKFEERIQSDLLPLELQEVDPNDDFYSARYVGITLPEDMRGPVYSYNENIYESPIENTAGDVHFKWREINKYFAHTRTEDTAKGFNKEMQPDEGSDTRRVIEIQSDLFQKEGLDTHTTEYFKRALSYEAARRWFSDDTKAPLYILYGDDTQGMVESLEDIDNAEENALKIAPEQDGPIRTPGAEKLDAYRNTWWERIIREEVKRAAADEKTKLQFPTGATAMKIEGLGESATEWYHNPNADEITWGAVNLEVVKPEDIRVGGIYGNATHGDSWVVTEVLGNGRFKAAVTADKFEISGAGGIAEWMKQQEIRGRTETFDLNGKSNTENPIFKFYEKDVARYLKNKYGAKRVTDAQGVEWMEVTIDPKMAEEPVLAYKLAESREDAWEYAQEMLLSDEEKDAIVIYRAELARDQAPNDTTIKLVKSGYKKYLDFVNAPKRTALLAAKIGEPFDITEAEGERLMRTMFDEDEINVLFRRNGVSIKQNNPNDVTFGLYQPARAYQSPMIQLLVNEGRVQSHTVYHEAFHAYMDRFVSKAERDEVLARVSANPVIKPALLLAPSAYRRDELAEEWLADDFARYVASQGHMTENTSFYQRILAKIRTWLRKITGAQKIYDDLLARRRQAPRKLPVIYAETEETMQPGDERDDARVRAKLRSIGWGSWFTKEREEARTEMLGKLADLPDQNRDLIRKDINIFEDITAQARDLYLKDPNEFEAARDFERVADQRRLKKAALDKRFSAILKPYTDLRGGSLEKVSNILMQGDLEAKEYSNTELRAMNLNEAEINGYNAAREAFNTAHRFLIGEMRKNGVPEDEIAEFERERVGYMPHKWKFHYVVKHQVRTKKGPWKTYQMDNFKSERLAREEFENLKAKNTRGDVRYTIDTLDNLEVDFFTEQRLSFDAMRSVIVQAKTSEEVKDQMLGALRNMIKEKGFGRNYMRRTGVRGYEKKEVPKIVADYFSGMNGYITKMEAAKKYYAVLSTIDARRQNKFYAWVRDMIAYDMGNTKEWQTVKTVAFMWYLANDLSFLATNATQNFTVGTGELSKYMTPAQKIVGPEAAIIKAMTQWSTGTVSAEERSLVLELVALGELGGEMVSELMGFKNNPLYTEISSRFNKVMYASTAWVEQNVNRVPMFLAARRLFIEQGMSEKQANEKALEVSNDVHFRYGKQNRPRFERGRVGTLFVFYHYMRSFLYQLWRDATHQEYAALTRKMLYTALLGGTLSLPFAKTLLLIFRTIFGTSCDVDGVEEDCTLAAEMPAWEVALTRGLPALSGVDLSGRVGIDLMSVASIVEDPNDIRSYIGAVGAILWVNPQSADKGGRLQQGIELMRQGRYDDAMGKLLPDFIANPIKAYAGHKWGVRSFAGTPLEDASGEAFKYNTWEAIIKATGFSPTRENLAWDAKSKQFMVDDAVQAARSRLRRTIEGQVQRGNYDEARATQDAAIADGTIDAGTNYVKEFGKKSFIKDALEEWNTTDHTAANLRKIENGIVESVYGSSATDIQKFNLRKEFAVYRTFGLKDALVDDLQGAKTNDERVDMLLKARERMGEEAFKEFIAQGRKTIRTEAGNDSYILISDDLLDMYKKAHAKQSS